MQAPASADRRLQELRAVATFMRTISLFPSMRASAADIARIVLPSLDTACSVADAPYESLSKKYGEAHADLVSLAARNRALLRSSEEGVLASLELERQSSALLSRIRELEAVSDDTLLEMVQDWLSSHRGSFDAVLFSKTHNMPPARAEEGLSRLLLSGEVKKISGSFQPRIPHTHGEFGRKKQTPISALSSLLGAISGKKRAP